MIVCVRVYANVWLYVCDCVSMYINVKYLNLSESKVFESMSVNISECIYAAVYERLCMCI